MPSQKAPQSFDSGTKACTVINWLEAGLIESIRWPTRRLAAMAEETMAKSPKTEAPVPIRLQEILKVSFSDCFLDTCRAHKTRDGILCLN